MSKVHATIIARGGGSTFHRKNTCRILGKPLIGYSIETCLKAGFIDDIFVWSEDEEIAKIARSMGVHALERPRTMVHYHSGFATQQEWADQRTRQIIKITGGPGDINVSFNCNNFLLRPETLRAMYRRGVEDERLGGVIAVAPVEPGLCLKAGDGSLFPFWNDPAVLLGEHPPLYRRLGVAVTCRMRIHRGCTHLAPHPVSPEEAIDLQNAEEVVLAEFYLRKRFGMSSSAEEGA